MSLFDTPSNNAVAKKLEHISMIFDASPELTELVYQDLIKANHHDTR
jgi:hypothetical protein